MKKNKKSKNHKEEKEQKNEKEDTQKNENFILVQNSLSVDPQVENDNEENARQQKIIDACLELLKKKEKEENEVKDEQEEDEVEDE